MRHLRSRALLCSMVPRRGSAHPTAPARHRPLQLQRVPGVERGVVKFPGTRARLRELAAWRHDHHRGLRILGRHRRLCVHPCCLAMGLVSCSRLLTTGPSCLRNNRLAQTSSFSFRVRGAVYTWRPRHFPCSSRSCSCSSCRVTRGGSRICGEGAVPPHARGATGERDMELARASFLAHVPRAPSASRQVAHAFLRAPPLE